MEPLEIVFVLAILLVIFGPEKLPKLARDLGQAIHEFRKASSSVVLSARSPSATRNAADVSKAISNIARTLNIETEGKNIKQVTQEIVTKIEDKRARK